MIVSIEILYVDNKNFGKSNFWIIKSQTAMSNIFNALKQREGAVTLLKYPTCVVILYFIIWYATCMGISDDNKPCMSWINLFISSSIFILIKFLS